MDVEATTPLRRRNEECKDTPNIDNPYQEKFSSQMAIYKKLKSLVFLLLSSFLLHEMKVFHNILHSSKVDHLWFRSGMAASVGKYCCTSVSVIFLHVAAQIVTLN